MARTPPFLEWLADLFRLPEQVDGIKTQLLEVRVIMAKYEDEIAAINAETDSLSARVDAVIAQLNNDDPAVEAELQSIASRLRGIAADPEQPVPPAEPTPEPAPGDGGEQPA